MQNAQAWRSRPRKSTDFLRGRDRGDLRRATAGDARFVADQRMRGRGAAVLAAGAQARSAANALRAARSRRVFPIELMSATRG
jgi:hypothetical protein